MRKLILSDAKELAKIRRKSFHDFWSEKEFISMLSDETFFGFKDDHGFILCRKIFETIDIVTFCVDPQYRSQGTGKKLLSELIKFSKCNGAEIFLEVAEKNFIAIKLYESFGFEKISERKNYYNFPDGLQNAIVMKFTKHL